MEQDYLNNLDRDKSIYYKSADISLLGQHWSNILTGTTKARIVYYGQVEICYNDGDLLNIAECDHGVDHHILLRDPKLTSPCAGIKVTNHKSIIWSCTTSIDTNRGHT